MRPLRIVVVDDDASICLFLRSAFVAEGHHCETFRCALDAERHLREYPADLAMLDVISATTMESIWCRVFAPLQPELHAVVMTAHRQPGIRGALGGRRGRGLRRQATYDRSTTRDLPQDCRYQAQSAATARGPADRQHRRRSWVAARACWRCSRTLGASLQLT